MTRRLGLVSSATGRPLRQSPSLTLGADEVDPLHVSAAYAAFAAEGKYCEPNPFEYVVDSAGTRVPGLGPACIRALRKDVADATAQAMRAVLEPGGTGDGYALAGREAAGKTGTSNGGMTGWFSGFTPDLSTSVSLASPMGPSRHPLAGADLGPRIATGYGVDAAPIWQQMMNAALDGVPPAAFGTPSGDEVHSSGP